MSVTKHLVCTTCKKYLWIGQSSALYTSPNQLEALRKFLLEDHADQNYGVEHNLLSVDDHEFGDGVLDGCEEVKVEA